MDNLLENYHQPPRFLFIKFEKISTGGLGWSSHTVKTNNTTIISFNILLLFSKRHAQYMVPSVGLVLDYWLLENKVMKVSSEAKVQYMYNQ